MKDSRFLIGIFLIALGGLWVFSNIFHIRFFTISNFWPLIVLAIGICFEAAYFITGKNIGLLVPGGILLTIGMLFIFETFTNWYFAAYTWPIYPLAVAIGLFQVYIFGERQGKLLIPIVILISVTVIAFMSMMLGNIFRWLNLSLTIPVILIIAGIAFIFSGKTGESK